MHSGRIIGRLKTRYHTTIFVVGVSSLLFLSITLQSSLSTNEADDIFNNDTYLHAMRFLASNIEYNEDVDGQNIAKNNISEDSTKNRKLRVVEVSSAARATNLRTRQKNQSHIHFNNILYVQAKLEDVIRRYGKTKTNAKLLSQKIIREALEQNYDPLFVAAVIKSESAFDSFARSNVGATGLMQIMPATGKYVEKFKDFEPLLGMSLTDPDYNLKLGIRYLKYLDEMFKNNKVLVLIAYNWGPGRVLDAFQGKRRVPPEVIRYATKILQDHSRWRREVGFS